MKRALILFLLVLLATPAVAQPAPSAPDRREKIKQRIRALRAYTLTEQLDLDEATAAKLFPALAKYDDEFEKLLAARADLQKRLEAAGALKDAKQVDALIDEAVANQRALWDTEAARLAQLRKILTPAQTARVLIVLPAMERRMINQLRRAAQAKQPAAKRPVTPNPADNIDPFDDGDLTKNPFDTPRPRKKDRARVSDPTALCDPFNSPQGCPRK